MKIQKVIASLAITIMIALGLIACEEINAISTNNDAGVVLRVISVDEYTISTDVTYGESVGGQLEGPFGDSFMSVEFGLDSIVQGGFDPNQTINNVDIEYYDVSYQCGEPDGALGGCASSITNLENVGLGVSIAPGKKVTFDGILLMTVNRKQEFEANGGLPDLYPVYFVTITFHAVNQFGESLEAVSHLHLVLGRYYTDPTS